MNKQLKEKLKKLTLCDNCGVSISVRGEYNKSYYDSFSFTITKSCYGDMFVRVECSKNYCEVCLNRIKQLFEEETKCSWRLHDSDNQSKIRHSLLTL